MERVYKELGKVVRKCRKTKGLTTLDLAKRLNVSVGHISNIENGKNDIFKLQLLFNLSKELNIPLNKLLNVSPLSVDEVAISSEKIEISFVKPDVIQNKDIPIINKYLKILVENYLDNMSNYNYREESIETITDHLVQELSFMKKLNTLKRSSPND